MGIACENSREAHGAPRSPAAPVQLCKDPIRRAAATTVQPVDHQSTYRSRPASRVERVQVKIPPSAKPLKAPHTNNIAIRWCRGTPVSIGGSAHVHAQAMIGGGLLRSVLFCALCCRPYVGKRLMTDSIDCTYPKPTGGEGRQGGGH